MTEKKENILSAALRLFAESGYDATSTSKVARAAGVSEGLIFRHFQNKEGLLKALMAQGRQKAQALYADISTLQDPKDILRSMLSLPFLIEEDQYDYWKLMYALKWQAEVYDSSHSAYFKELLTGVFKNLGYSDPVAEAELALALIDGAATSILLRKPTNAQAIQKALLAKYGL